VHEVAAWANFLTFSCPDFTFSTKIITYNSGRISRLVFNNYFRQKSVLYVDRRSVPNKHS